MPIPLSTFTPHTPAILALIKELVAIESPSTDKAAVDKVSAFLAPQLRDLGATVQVVPQTTAGNHLVARWGTGENPLVMLCHMDTVYDVGTLANQPCYEAEGKLYGPGVVDMKASIALALTALRVLQEHNVWPHRPVKAVFTSDEEVGSTTSRALVEQECAGAALVLCLEFPLPDGSLKTARKGVGDFELRARGRAAHAGAAHADGRNAIEELAHHILALQKLTDYAKGTTLNVGVVQGGSRSNIVPDEARAVVDVRVTTPEEAERVTKWMRGLKPVLAEVTLEVEGGMNRPPMPRDKLMEKTFKRAQQIGQQLGLRLTEGSTGGGSDGNFVAPLGVPILDGLGALGEGAHSGREHLLISSLPERTALLAALLTEW